jgi:tRNA (adenine22-N1)-methyltransferase
MTAGALNARLAGAAEMTRQNAIFADIGTDHAYLPLFLLDEGRINFAYCSDINEGPLASARRNAEERGRVDQMEFILTDGAAALSGKGITDYAICGMGGELICDIISKASQLYDGGVNLILQPMSRQATLRKFLAKEGFSVKCESYSYDAGKYYVCLLATYTGDVREIGEIEAELGFSDAEYRDTEARLGYLDTLYNARLRAMEGKIRGGMENPPERALLDAINEVRKEL